jgi:hypothetical protein
MGMAMELWQLEATELARLIRLGQVSSREAVASCLARMEAVNEKLNAVVRQRSDPIGKDLISPAGSRWPNRNDCWPQQPTDRMVPAS